MTYLLEKNRIVENLTQSYGCSLLRDGDDLDFGLLEKNKKTLVYNFLIEKDFICTSNKISTMNFKKFVGKKILDIDIAITTKYLNYFFLDVEVKKEFEQKYFEAPQENEIAMTCLRYILLLRGTEAKYRQFFYENKKEIEGSNFFLKYLTKSLFRKNLNFEQLMSVISRDKKAIFFYVKIKYILYFILFKIKFTFCKKRGKIVAVVGIDGSGKSTILKVLKRELNYPVYYMGERGFIYDEFYNQQKSILLKPISFLGKYAEKIYRYSVLRNTSKKNAIVLTDRFHKYSKSALNKKTKIGKMLGIFDRLFFLFYPSPDKYIVLWNEPEVILSRKKEVTKKQIQNFNDNKENYFKNAAFIKNDTIDETLNLILKELYN